LNWIFYDINLSIKRGFSWFLLPGEVVPSALVTEEDN